MTRHWLADPLPAACCVVYVEAFAAVVAEEHPGGIRDDVSL